MMEKQLFLILNEEVILGGTKLVCVGIWIFLLLVATLLNEIQHHLVVHLFCSFLGTERVRNVVLEMYLNLPSQALDQGLLCWFSNWPSVSIC